MSNELSSQEILEFCGRWLHSGAKRVECCVGGMSLMVEMPESRAALAERPMENHFPGLEDLNDDPELDETERARRKRLREEFIYQSSE